MDTPPEQKRPESKQRKLLGLAYLITLITGTSVDAFARAPSGERRKVYTVSLVIVLIAVLAALGVGVAIDFARGGVEPLHMLACVVTGLLLLGLEISYVRNHWEFFGRRALRERGWQTEAPPSQLRLALQIALRVVFSVIIGLAVAGFLELYIFEQDTITQIAKQNRKDNEGVYAAATARVEAQIAAQRNEIARLTTQADTIVNDARSTNDANQRAATQERQVLNQERAQLRQNEIELQKELNRHTHNMNAEETGQARYNGAPTVPGRGPRYANAARMTDHYRTQIIAIQNRIAQIDSALARIPVLGASTDVSAQAQNRLNQINRDKVAAESGLNTLLANRDEAIRVSAEKDSNYVPLPDGLIERGKALLELASTSPWLQARMLSISALLVALDLIGLVVISMVPVPLGIAKGEVVETDMVIGETMAQAEVALTGYHKIIQDARLQRAKYENASDEQMLHERAKTWASEFILNPDKMRKHARTWGAANGNSVNFSQFR